MPLLAASAEAVAVAPPPELDQADKEFSSKSVLKSVTAKVGGDRKRKRSKNEKKMASLLYMKSTKLRYGICQ